MAYQPLPVGSYVATWGEGPLWWEDRLLYVDIEAHKLVRFDPISGREEIWDAGERVGTVVPRAQGGAVIGGDHGFSAFDFATGRKTPLADPEPDKKPQNRLNDGKCDPAGRFWAGSISTVKKTGDARLYMLDRDLTVTEKYGPVTNSNGICWSADARTMFYIDTPTRKVTAFDFDLATGGLSNPRTAVDVGALGLEGSPDGMTIDAAGNLWVAICHGGCVCAFDPATGQELERIQYPCIETTAPAFGGPGLRTLFVTTGIKKDLAEPLAGRLFAVELPVAGVPAFAFAG